jgi:hypothetical protein
VIGGASAAALECGFSGILTGAVPAAKRLGEYARASSTRPARRAGAVVDKENVVHPTELPQT